MCRCCQSIFESCYWHCYGKWNFDEDIALYEDETTQQESKKDSRAIDNMAFWDSVQMIANRSTIITQPTITKHSIPGMENSFAIDCAKRKSIQQCDTTNIFNFDKNKINEDQIDSKVECNKSILRTKDTPQNINLTDEEKCVKFTEETIGDDGPKVKYRKQSAVENMIRRSEPSERQRKKSLKERRNSTADLTLDIMKFDFHEIPIIRQEHMPKHFESYTPEYNPFVESNVFTSPMLIPETPQYDLKSVVQYEKEFEHAHQVKRPLSRIENIKRKMPNILVKKPSTKSLPDSINHI